VPLLCCGVPYAKGAEVDDEDEEDEEVEEVVEPNAVGRGAGGGIILESDISG